MNLTWLLLVLVVVCLLLLAVAVCAGAAQLNRAEDHARQDRRHPGRQPRSGIEEETPT